MTDTQPLTWSYVGHAVLFFAVIAPGTLLTLAVLWRHIERWLDARFDRHVRRALGNTVDLDSYRQHRSVPRRLERTRRS